MRSVTRRTQDLLQMGDQFFEFWLSDHSEPAPTLGAGSLCDGTPAHEPSVDSMWKET